MPEMSVIRLNLQHYYNYIFIFYACLKRFHPFHLKINLLFTPL